MLLPLPQTRPACPAERAKRAYFPATGGWVRAAAHSSLPHPQPYSPDIFQSREHYLRYHPGDEYVDVLAYDDYILPATFADTIRVDTLSVDALSSAAVDTTAAPASNVGQAVLTDTVTVFPAGSAQADRADTSAVPADSKAGGRALRRARSTRYAFRTTPSRHGLPGAWPNSSEPSRDWPRNAASSPPSPKPAPREFPIPRAGTIGFPRH